MSIFGNKAAGFSKPTLLPSDDAQRHAWQEANRDWWEANPMRYDWRDEIAAEAGTGDYFDEIDRRFLSSAHKYLPCRSIPFDTLIPYAELTDKDVLEIGVGQGTHAQLLAPRCRSFTGIDLTRRAVEATSTRLALQGIPAGIQRMDAERMAFPAASFDFIWSWGVIHHSADTRAVLKEMARVLRPGGRATVMVYHRSWWCFYVCGLLRRIFQKPALGDKNLHQIAQYATDGAIARYYSIPEWRASASEFFLVESMSIYGLKPEILPLPHGRLKSVLEDMIPDVIARTITNRLGMGSFLVSTLVKT